jgi:hypothetical protein
VPVVIEFLAVPDLIPNIRRPVNHWGINKVSIPTRIFTNMLYYVYIHMYTNTYTEINNYADSYINIYANASLLTVKREIRRLRSGTSN